MRIGVFLVFSLLLVTSCVPVKKYEELLAKEKQCSEELSEFKTKALNSMAEVLDLKSKYEVASKELALLKEEVSALDLSYKTLLAKYDKLVQINSTLETNYDKLRLMGAKETALLHADLEAKQIELQKKEDALLAAEKELLVKEHLLAERERRVNELEAIIKSQEDATRLLKEKVAQALKGFENKGLKVEEKNGKIYVSMEAKLLFASGSIVVEQEGKNALIGLSKVLENEKELEIIVEGHTDVDQLAGTKHPKNNWELSVLRSTAVIEIMMANSNINPTQLMAAGRSEFVPVDPGDKAKNRRIEIIISPNLNALYELISQ